jgi:cytochrome c-type biogenesis protein CcmH
MRRLAPLLLAALLAAGPAPAATSPDERLADLTLEARARELSKELRCLVCQNQAIDDSDAELARDLRRLVRERLQAGDSDAAIRAFLVDRYGEFVLLKPPVRPATWLLWAGPALVLVLGGGLAAVALHRRRVAAGVAPLSAAERQELQGLLGDRAP